MYDRKDIFKARLTDGNVIPLFDLIDSLKTHQRNHQRMLDDGYHISNDDDGMIKGGIMISAQYNKEIEEKYDKSEIYVSNLSDSEDGFGKLAKLLFFNHTPYVFYSKDEKQFGYSNLLKRRFDAVGAKILGEIKNQEWTDYFMNLG